MWQSNEGPRPNFYYYLTRLILLAVSLALIFHELATNAGKYGAFSSARGFLQVSWSVSDDRLNIIWDETEGPGEIFVRGPNLFSGYWPDGADGPDAAGWLGTGDLAYRDVDGDLHLVDRRSDLILVSGFNVYPAEVERVLDAHPAVAESAVIGVPDARTGAAVRAVVVVAPGQRLIGLKAGGEFLANSAILQSIDYAISNGANVINESFGANVYSDNNARDTIQLFDDAAVRHGITVTVSTGDAGVSGTQGSPSTDPNVISAGASTDFQSYEQTGYAGARRRLNWLPVRAP